MIRDRRGTKTAGRHAEWMAKRTAKRDARPFFAWMHVFDPHQPYQPIAADRAVCPTLYDAEIMGADRAVGIALDAVRKAGALENTIVVLTADHGESLGEHQEKTHAIFVYDATMHVPLIVSWPKRLPSGRVYSGPVSSVDIVPTLLDLLGLPGAGETQGFDLVPAVLGRTAAPQRPQYIESLVSAVGFGMAPLQGVRLGGYKWIRAPRPEVYDLRKDPQELQNVYAQERPRAAALDRELERILADSGRRSIDADAKENPMSRETAENLMSLGYLAPRADRESMHGIDPKDGIVIHEKLETARHFAQNRRWARAAAVLTGLLAESPENVSARNTLAFCLVRQGDFDGAREQYRASLERDPKQSRVFSMLGALATRQANLDEAEKDFRRALEITPGFVEAMGNLGFLCALRGDEKGAREWYDKAVAADPGYPRAYRLIADLYYEHGDFSRALDYYRKTLAAGPRDFQALVQAGNSSRRVGDPKGARDFFEAAARLRPDSWIPPYDLACLEAVQGHTVPSITSLEQSLRRGLNDSELLEKDPDLASVRGSPLFQMMLSRVRRSPVEPEGEEESKTPE
jgi:choline-sulfatase